MNARLGLGAFHGLSRTAGGAALRRAGVCVGAVIAIGLRGKQVHRQLLQELLEGEEVRGAAEEVVQHLALNVPHQLGEHLVRFILVLDERILLPVSAQVHGLAQCVVCKHNLEPCCEVEQAPPNDPGS